MAEESNKSNNSERKEILQSLFEDPYLKLVAKRVRNKTMALPATRRKHRRSQLLAEKREESPILNFSQRLNSGRRIEASKIVAKPPASAEPKTIASSSPSLSATKKISQKPSPITVKMKKVINKDTSMGNKPTTAGNPSSQQHAEDISWMIEELSHTMENASPEIFNCFVSNLQQNKKVLQTSRLSADAPANQDLSQDLRTFARQIEVEPQILQEALQDEGFSSLAQLYTAFREMGANSFTSGNFEIFVRGLVNSYIDKKNEEAMLDLIGVSAQTGGQKLATSYAYLLSEIFRPQVGGFFLNNTKNLNYNCFNLGNIIQENLLNLDEFTRVSYLENILTLLQNREELLEKSHTIVQSDSTHHSLIRSLSDPVRCRSLLKKYMADLAIFKLALLSPNDLPDDITSMVPKNIDELMKFVVDFPDNIYLPDERLKYMLEKLLMNEPLIFTN